MAETKAPFPETTEYIVYEENKILGFSIDANNKIKAINQDIYSGIKKEEKRPVINFIKILSLSVLAIVALFGFKKLFK